MKKNEDDLKKIKKINELGGVGGGGCLTNYFVTLNLI